MSVLKKALSLEEIKKQMGRNTEVKGVIAIHLDDIVNHDSEDYLDFLSNKLTDSPLLMDIKYKVVGHEGNILFIEVRGDASSIIEFELSD